MRPVREITAEEENYRAVPMGPFDVVRRDPVEPEPVGTIVLTAFRIVGYDPDCDGSLMARLEQIDKDGKSTGWRQDAVPLYPDTELVVTLDELKALFAKS
jgi:hypothetical protein